MEEYPTRWAYEDKVEETLTKEQAIRFLFHVLTGTIYASADDYDQAVEDFFTQIEALGLLIGAGGIDEVSLFLRNNCRPV